MPTYKNLPKTKSKKADDLPFYRPIDHLAYSLWQKRKALTPFVVVGAAVLFFFVGVKLYFAQYDRRAEILAASGDQKALELVIQKYPRSVAAQTSRMKLAKAAMDQKDWKKAMELYGPVATHPSAPGILRVTALQNMGLAQLKSGDFTSALASLEKASKDSDNADVDYTELLMARAHEMKGDQEKAKEKYKNLAEGAKNLMVKDEAKERLSWLE